MANMKSKFAFALLLINLIIISSNFFLFKISNREDNKQNTKSQFHLRGSKNETVQFEKSSENPKEQKRPHSPIEILISILHYMTLVFLSILFFSFWITNNECCIRNADDDFPIGNCYGNCRCCDNFELNEERDFRCLLNWNFEMPNNADLGDIIGAVIFYIILYVISILIYFILNILVTCGKHILRIVSLISLIIIEATIASIFIHIGSYIYLRIMTISYLLCVFCNLLGLISPFFESCRIQNQINVSDETERLIKPEEKPIIEPLINNPTESKPPVVDYFGELDKRYKINSGNN